MAENPEDLKHTVEGGGGIGSSVFPLVDTESWKGMPVFTDGRFAEEFLKAAGIEGPFVIGMIENREQFKEVLRRVQSNASFVVFDPPVRGSISGRVIPMADATVDDLPLSEGPGVSIGAYKLLEQIGEGCSAGSFAAGAGYSYCDFCSQRWSSRRLGLCQDCLRRVVPAAGEI